MLLITGIVNAVIIKNLFILAYLFLLIYFAFSSTLLTILSIILFLLFIFFVAVSLALISAVIWAFIIITNLIIIFIANFTGMLFIYYLLPLL